MSFFGMLILIGIKCVLICIDKKIFYVVDEFTSFITLISKVLTNKY